MSTETYTLHKYMGDGSLQFMAATNNPNEIFVEPKSRIRESYLIYKWENLQIIAQWVWKNGDWQVHSSIDVPDPRTFVVLTPINAISSTPSLVTTSREEAFKAPEESNYLEGHQIQVWRGGVLEARYHYSSFHNIWILSWSLGLKE